MNSMLTGSIVTGSLLGIAVGFLTVGLYLGIKQQETTEDELRRCIAQASASISDVPIQDFSQAHAACFNTQMREEIL